ncbi:MAG: hypothetical protein GY749_03550 [Desulfobacteraceae bacterium]|nr:hypothetical protein [Desulfobacteraceae bacterium]
MVRLPESLSPELSLVLGNIISGRLPTSQAREWKKKLVPWDKYGGIDGLNRKKQKGIPEDPWPVQAILSAYPGKRVYGTGELICFEIKLVKNDADHGLFLELILPALEELGTKMTPEWKSSTCLWGRFDIHSVYAARGSKWEPFVKQGRLDLDYKPTPSQWADDLVMNRVTRRTLDKLTWVTTFDMSEYEMGWSVNLANKSQYTGPSLKQMLEAFLGRMGSLISGKPVSPEDALSLLSAKARFPLENAVEKAARIPVLSNDIQYMPDSLLGKWAGSQTFATSVPDMILFYLNLASIFHIGKYTHYGCGSFILE